MSKFSYKITNHKFKTKSRYFHNALILFFIISLQITSFAQSELIEENEYNRDSRSLVFMLNSNGYSAGFRFSKRIDGFKSRLIDIDLAWYRHPKERRQTSFHKDQSKFVFGKTNQLFNARIGYGKQKEIFGKYASKGISISYYYTIGGSLGLLKPVYYEIITGFDAKDRPYTKTDKFNKEEILNPGQIYGGGSFTKGFDEIQLAYGGYAKLAFSFDINKRYRAINTLEFGVMLELFHKELPLMEYTSQPQYIFTMFIAYRFGQKLKTSIISK